MTSPPIDEPKTPGDGVRVLYVGARHAPATVSALERHSDRISVRAVPQVASGEDVLTAETVDCVVAEYDSEPNGAELLQYVADRRPDCARVLFADPETQPSVAETVAADLTDYYLTPVTDEEYAALAARIETSVDRTRERSRERLDHEWLRALVAETSDLVAVLDDDWTVTYATGPSTPLAIRPDGGYVGQSLFDGLVHPSDRDRVEDQLAQLADDPQASEVRLEFPTATEETSWEWVSATVADRRATALDGFVVTARNTPWRARNRRFGWWESQDEPAWDIADVGVWEYEVDTDTVWWSTRTGHFRAASVESETSLADALDQFHPEDRAAVQAAFDRAISDAEAFERVFRLDADGDDEWLRVRGVPVLSGDTVESIRGLYQDVTDLKQRERQFRSLHEASRELMRADTRTDVAEITIDAMENILGYVLATVRLVDEEAGLLRTVAATDRSVAEAGERPDYGLDEDVPAARTYHRQEPEIFADLDVVDDEYERGTVRSCIYMPIGEYGVLSCGETEPDVYDEADVDAIGVLTRVAATALARIESEREIRRQKDRLEEFASIVAHDLRNPLQIAMGHLDHAAETGADDSFAQVRSSHERMASLIEDLLTLAREGDGGTERTRVDLTELAESSWHPFTSESSTLEVGSFEEPIYADESKLRELFENLFRNSVEHGSTSSRTESDDAVEHGSTSLPSQAQEDNVEHGGDSVSVRVGPLDDGFFVEDDGPGIPDDRKESVFEMGFTTASGGTGYGLYIVQEMARSHGWDVTVTDSSDGGARFEITGVDTA